jgi:hypothetical protein
MLLLLGNATTIAALCVFTAPGGVAPGVGRMASQDDDQNPEVTAFLTDERWPEVRRIAEAWSKRPPAERARLAGELAPALTDRRLVGLRDPEDLIIVHRLLTGDLKWQGHGLVVRQDLFVTGGRAAWAISRLMDADVPELNAGLTPEQWEGRAAVIARQVKDFQAAARKADK